MDLVTLIGRARQHDLEAFAEITRRFQHMAFGYALSILRDLGQAEDVVQEAFVAAWFGLGRLEDPAAFPGWLRGIVRHQAHRVLRRKRREAALPLAEAQGLAVEASEPEGRIERGRRAGTVLAAVAELPEPLREVITLFYVHECSQQDIATFLGLPVTTVNNRLHAGRPAQAEGDRRGEGHARFQRPARRLRRPHRPHRAGARGRDRGALRSRGPAGRPHRADGERRGPTAADHRAGRSAAA
jgi:RNA polymerase sigma factor (sigma-70 family)